MYIYILVLGGFFWPHRVACGIRIEPVPPSVEAWSLNHWTSKEVPIYSFFLI